MERMAGYQQGERKRDDGKYQRVIHNLIALSDEKLQIYLERLADDWTPSEFFIAAKVANDLAHDRRQSREGVHTPEAFYRIKIILARMAFGLGGDNIQVSEEGDNTVLVRYRLAGGPTMGIHLLKDELADIQRGENI